MQFFFLSLHLTEMKRIVSISLMFLMLGYAFIQIGVFIEYVVDIEGYTQKYCVNVNQPEKKCNGKCQLTKQLAENEEQQQNNEVQSSPEILLFNILNKVELPEAVENIRTKEKTFEYVALYTEGNPNSIFQPPKITVI